MGRQIRQRGRSSRHADWLHRCLRPATLAPARRGSPPIAPRQVTPSLPSACTTTPVRSIGPGSFMLVNDVARRDLVGATSKSPTRVMSSPRRGCQSQPGRGWATGSAWTWRCEAAPVGGLAGVTSRSAEPQRSPRRVSLLTPPGGHSSVGLRLHLPPGGTESNLATAPGSRCSLHKVQHPGAVSRCIAERRP